jgi:hypothetical protein
MALDLKSREEGAPAAEPALRARKLTSVDHAPSPPAHLPWSYGEDRVTAMVIDPDRLFVYFEVTDPAIERARAALGAAGARAWLSLRVHDTTGRIFDGSNAHSYFDRGIDRGDREHFFDLRKPGSEAIVELGMRAEDGRFAKIARSGRALFPRSEPAPWSEPEWMTVRVATGEIVGGARAGAGARGGAEPWPGSAARAPAAPAAQAPPPAERRDGSPGWRVAVSWDEVFPGEEWSALHAWEEVVGAETAELLDRLAWEGETLVSTWEAGPFSHPVEVIAPSWQSFAGPVRRYQVGERTVIVHGPWQVVIRGLGAHGGRRVIARWEVHRRWTVGARSGMRPVAVAGGAAPGGASERVLGGASEWRLRGASELRLGGASELYFAGASERRFRGASELSYLGASELRVRGASELRFRGASELRFRGASELRLGGASELRLGGASELRLGGASELRLGGASELRIGGASEVGQRYPSLPAEKR